MRLGRIGFDNVAGYLKDGLRSADNSRARIVSTERIGADVAAQRLASTSPPLVIDVRTAAERAQKQIAGSVHIPLNRLLERLDEIPSGRPLLVHCAGGYRSSMAASLLQRAGRSAVSELAGGIAAWEAAGY
jgi:rhodanese-related sulfurtransferase